MDYSKFMIKFDEIDEETHIICNEPKCNNLLLKGLIVKGKESVKCDDCKVKRSAYMKKWRKPVKPKAYTRDCRYCEKTFTTERVNGSHAIFYCSEECKKQSIYDRANTDEAKAKQKEYREKNRETLIAKNKVWYEKNKVLKGTELTKNCKTCGNEFTRKKTKKGFGCVGLYCSKKCWPSEIARKLKTINKKNQKIYCQLEECGKEIIYDGRIGNKHQVKWCSWKCQNANMLKDPTKAIAARFRTLLWQHCRRGNVSDKTGRAFRLLGYTPKQFREWFESQFTGNMSWEEFNKGNIHIDHIIPITAFSFDSTDHPDFHACWALGNLRPMWAKDNISKGNKIPGVDYI